MSAHTGQHDEDRSTHGPTNLMQFIRMFPNEEACVKYLAELRWPDGFVCPKCGSRKAWQRAAGDFECNNKHRTSVTAGTVMHGSRQPLTIWFYGAYLVSTLTPGISAVQFQKQLGLTRYETAYQILHKLRSAMVAPDREPLSGTVEVDEAFIGGREDRDRMGTDATNKTIVVVGVEIVEWDAPDPMFPDDPDAAILKRRAGRVRMSVIPNTDAASLLPWVAKNIAKGTVVMTDGSTSYNGVKNLGYGHVRTLQSHRGSKTGDYLPMIHLIISNLKRWLLGTHKGAVSGKHLQAYLNEFAFRFNRRFWRGPAFVRALGLAVNAAEWPTWGALYADKGADGRWVHPNPRPIADDALVETVWSVLCDAADAEGRADVAAWMRNNAATARAQIRARMERE